MAGAMQFMQLGDGLGRIQVVGQRFEHRTRHALRRRVAVEVAVPLPQRLVRLVETDMRPVERLTVMRPEHVEAKRLAGPRITLPTGQQLMHGDEIAETLRHLLPFDLEEAVMHPDLPGKQVIVGKDHVSRRDRREANSPNHPSELEHPLEVDSMRIDLGPEGKANVGDRATFATKFKRVGPSIMSKAIDDRIGVAILIELLKHAPKNIELCLSFSVQEEIGLRGAKVAAHYFEPDLAIAVDSTPARDLPDYEGKENFTYNTRLGFGPAIYMANSSTLDDPRLVRFLAETAEKNKIQYQFRQPGGGGTNAGAIQQSRAGVPVVSVSVPHRYTHSPISISRVEDWKNTLNLLHVALKKMTL